MKVYLFPHMARALALVLLFASIAALAASNAAWAGPSQAGPRRQPGRSTVPRRGTDLELTQTYRRVWWDDVIFTITVTNTGPIAAQDVFVTDRISKRLQFEEMATTKGVCVGDPIVKCQLGDMAVGEVVTITIRAAIWLDRYPGAITNTATVYSRTRDVKPSNDRATVNFKGRNSDFSWFDSLTPD